MQDEQNSDLNCRRLAMPQARDLNFGEGDVADTYHTYLNVIWPQGL